MDQVWECPECGAQTACGPPGMSHPPSCGRGHEMTEMEQGDENVPDTPRDTTVPPDAAVRAAVRGMTAESDHFEGHVRRGLAYAMNPELGPDRLVRLGDVVDFLREHDSDIVASLFFAGEVAGRFGDDGQEPT